MPNMEWVRAMYVLPYMSVEVCINYLFCLENREAIVIYCAFTVCAYFPDRDSALYSSIS